MIKMKYIIKIQDTPTFETTLYGLRTNLLSILKYLIPKSEISFYGEFIKIQSADINPKDRLKQIEGVMFKK